jgi:hypothetical protein
MNQNKFTQSILQQIDKIFDVSFAKFDFFIFIFVYAENWIIDILQYLISLFIRSKGVAFTIHGWRAMSYQKMSHNRHKRAIKNGQDVPKNMA